MSIPDHNFSRKDGDAHRVPDAATARFLEALGFQAGVINSAAKSQESTAEVFYVLCPGCHEELSIGRANFGVEGPCPTCGTRIVADQDGDGSVQARMTGQFCPPPSLLEWPSYFSARSGFKTSTSPTGEPLPASKFPASQERNLVRMEYLVDPSDVKPAMVTMKKGGRGQIFKVAGIAAGLILAGIAAALVSQSGNQNESSNVAAAQEEGGEQPLLAKVSNASVEPQSMESASHVEDEVIKGVQLPEISELIPEPVLEVELAPTSTSAIEHEPEQGPTREEVGEATVRAFLAADNLDAKARWILKPAENQPQLREFYFMEALVHPGEPEVQHVETRQTDKGQWISLFDVFLSASLPHRVLVVHQDGIGAKVDFGLYRQMRENALHRFLAGPDSGSSRQFRVMLRQTDRDVAAVSANFKEPALFFEARLPFFPGAPGMVAVPVDSPVLEELQNAFFRHEGDLPAVVELKWQPSEVDPREWVVTISQLVRLGLWE
tara:strand:- start:12406 stop:13884 length:1479 start_codon:yes stop_codon:yes gene_type:complete